jgi:prephenate dehydratase
VIRVAFQGEPGAYGEEAIAGYFGPDAADAVAMPTFSAVCDAVASGSADAGVLPLENSLAGTVGDALDALAAGSLMVVGEVLQPIRHHLLVLPKATLAGVEEVRSHWQALSQCDRFLSRQSWNVVPAADTAGAARQLASEGDARVAAIASERAASLYGLSIAARDIQDASENVTRFAVIARSQDSLSAAAGHGDPDRSSGERETLITFETGHRPGDLVRALAVLADAGINMSRIESRPSGDGPWRYRFLVQVAGDAAEDPLRFALVALREHTRAMRVLGSFSAG